jgi:predicted dithiol-disulfide oxidoreductase (DUF899 family)
MMKHAVVSREDWTKQRKELLVKEKELTKLRDQLSEMRRQLPWEKVESDYVFAGMDADVTLSQLFDGKSQLIVYHFMFAPDWEQGCKSCSFLADHYEPSVLHLKHRDVSMVTVSRAPIEQIEAFKKRMDWTFNWVSSLNNDFNYDYQVSFPQEAAEKNEIYYNYTKGPFFSSEGPGISVFYKDEHGDTFHTYSTYGRGLDMFLTAYHLLDLVPKGRDEEGLVYGMEWLRHKDQYDNPKVVDQWTAVILEKGKDSKL